MAIEKLIPKKEEYQFPSICYPYNLKTFRHTSEVRVFYSQYEYWYDGRKFLIGKFKSGNLGLIDVETYAWAVFPDAKATKEDLIRLFKRKVDTSGKTIHEVVREYKKNNLDLELWLINSLSI